MWARSLMLGSFVRHVRSKAVKNCSTSNEAGLEYRKVNREVRKKLKAAKEEWTEEQCKNIEKGMM